LGGVFAKNTSRDKKFPEPKGEANLVSSLVFFSNTPPKHDISPSRAANRQIHSEYFNHCLTITNRNTTTEGNSSKRPIVFNNCQVTNNKKKNIPENDKQKVLFIKLPLFCP
jgi:hypothetical protein